MSEAHVPTELHPRYSNLVCLRSPPRFWIKTGQILKILFICLTGRDRAREGTQAGGEGGGEAGFPRSREPNAGLDPRTPGS